MPKFMVRLSATATVSSLVEVEADDKDQAAYLAVDVAKSGDCVWSYDGCHDETIAVETSSEVKR